MNMYFYFCDERNHCIRILTPTGRVVTFAGRGNDSSDPGFAMVHYVQKLVLLIRGRLHTMKKENASM